MKKNLKLALYAIVFIAGLVILYFNIKLGHNEVSGIMKANGGSMDTDTYLIYLEQSIIQFRFIGLVLSLLGGLGVIKTM
jgi:hypothetical protein